MVLQNRMVLRLTFATGGVEIVMTCHDNSDPVTPTSIHTEHPQILDPTLRVCSFDPYLALQSLINNV